MSVKVSRRALLAAPAALARGINRTVFLAAPHGAAVMACAFYTSARGGDMLSIEQRWTRSDTIDVAYLRRSHDYGVTWTTPEEVRTGERRPEGMLRRHPRAGFVDPHTGRYVEFWTEGVLPSDDPLEGMRNWNVYYRVSPDGGRTFDVKRQVIQSGDGFDERHPLPGVWTGKNCVMLGDLPSLPLFASENRILIPVVTTPLGADGKLFNPTGGYTYTDGAVLLGQWQRYRYIWTLSDLVKGDPSRCTRGMDEPTLGFLRGQRILMVLRGSNDRRPEFPGYRWAAYSTDGGHTWTTPEPWTYDDGSTFFSPSACSQLLRHSSGRLFWLGNITPENPHGNRPRYPFVIGEVDLSTGLLLRSSIRIVDTLGPDDDPVLTLSNFYAREDRRTREVVVHMSRMFAKPKDWSGDAYMYRIRV